MRVLTVAAALLLSTGCNSSQLRFTTLKISRTIPDLQERQVLDNLARVADDPGNLPYYSVINTGTVNISDSASGGLSSLSFQHKIFPSASLNSGTSRSVTGNWTLNALVSPDRLRAMRAAYMIALGQESIDPIDLHKLNEIEKAQSLPGIAPGWLCVGGKRDIPKGSRLVSHEGDTYIAVKPEHAKDFADFALLILNIATYTPTPPSSGSDITKISLSIDKIVPIEIKEPSKTRTITPEALPDPLQPIFPANPPPNPEPPIPTPAPATPPAIHPRLYEDSPAINRGLFFVPR